MPSLKAKPPIYPRPVSPISAEPIPVAPDEHIYESANSTEDGTDKDGNRLAKKRRIEKLGEQYLRGQPLMITSASLRGPLIGWKNPWIRRRTDTKKRRRKDEVPETRKIRRYLGPEVLETVVNHETLHQPHRSQVCLPATEQHIVATKAAVGQGNQIGNSTQDVKVRRVEDWLRTNDAFGNKSNESHSPSPTPVSASGKPALVGVHQLIKPADESEKVPAIELLEDSVEAHHAKHPSVPNRTKLSSKPEAATTTVQLSSLNKPDKNVHNLPCLQGVNDCELKNSRDDSRAEFAILKAKQRLIRTLPTSTNLSPFEYKRVSDTVPNKSGPGRAWIMGESAKHGSRAQLKDSPQSEEAIRTARMDVNTEIGKIDATNRSALPNELLPDRSADTTDPDTSNALPSAQIVDMKPFGLFKFAVSTGKELDVLENSAAIVQEHRKIGKSTKSANTLSPRQTPASPLKPVRHQSPPVVSGSESLAVEPAILKIYHPPSSPVAANLNTQEMLAAISPIVLSTIKKPKLTSGTNLKQTPATATKSKPRKSHKHSKLAAKSPKRNPPVALEPINTTSSGSNTSTSQGSIKTALKVAKSNKLIEPKKSCVEGNSFATLEVAQQQGENDTSAFNFSPLHHEPGTPELFSTPPATATVTKQRPDLDGKHIHPKASTIRTQQSTAPSITTTTTNPPPPSHQPSAPVPTADSVMNSHTGPEHTKTPLATTSQDKIKSYQLLDNSKDVEDEEMAGMGEVDFNLDAAIDDLGSYLGTWDPEREASFL